MDEIEPDRRGDVTALLATLGVMDASTVHFEANSMPGRVSIVHGATCEVVTIVDGEVDVLACQYATTLNLSPVAGDWVSVRGGYVVAVCARRTALTRPGVTGRDVQVLAANLDVVLVVVPIDRELNVLMLERLTVMAFDSGARPVVVLTKSDDAADVESRYDAARAAVPGVEVMTTSSHSGHGIDDLRSLLHAGVTAVMLGPSGAGKTSLLNAIEGTTELTRTLSRGGEGRHATTTRRLYRLTCGGVLLDVPGIRLLDVLIARDGLDEAFADVAMLAQDCRFRDCAHDGDEGCAVEQAVVDEELPARRLESWRTFHAEMLELERQRAQEESTRRRRSGRSSRRKHPD